MRSLWELRQAKTCPEASICTQESPRFPLKTRHGATIRRPPRHSSMPGQAGCPLGQALDDVLDSQLFDGIAHVPGGKHPLDPLQEHEVVLKAGPPKQLVQKVGYVLRPSLSEEGVTGLDHGSQMAHSEAIHLDELNAPAPNLSLFRHDFVRDLSGKFRLPSQETRGSLADVDNHVAAPVRAELLVGGNESITSDGSPGRHPQSFEPPPG